MGALTDPLEHPPFRSADGAPAPISVLALKLARIDLVAHWRRCGTTADFIGDFLSDHFHRPATAANVLSTVVNELIENAVKFSLSDARSVEVSVPLFDDCLIVQTRHLAQRDQADALLLSLEALSASTPEVLFLEQLEHTAAEDREASGLGFITLVKDYGAILGARITPTPQEGVVGVTVQARLSAELIDQT